LNIYAEGETEVSNTESEAQAEATILLQQARAEAAKQTIDGHVNGLNIVK